MKEAKRNDKRWSSFQLNTNVEQFESKAGNRILSFMNAWYLPQMNTKMMIFSESIIFYQVNDGIEKIWRRLRIYI